MIIEVVAGALVGLLVGSAFFGGLAWTVRRLPRSAHPVPIVLASFALRASASLVVFVLIARWSLIALAAALAAFVVARFVIVRYAGERMQMVTEE